MSGLREKEYINAVDKFLGPDIKLIIFIGRNNYHKLIIFAKLYMGTKYISKIILFVTATFLSINYLFGQNSDSIKTINIVNVPH